MATKRSAAGGTAKGSAAKGAAKGSAAKRTAKGGTAKRGTAKGSAAKRGTAKGGTKRSPSAIAGKRAGKRGAGAGDPDRRRKRKKRQRFLPFAFVRQGLEVTVAALTLDGTKETAPVDPDRRVVSLEGDDWQRAQLSVEVNVSTALLAAVVPPSEQRADGVTPVALLLVLRCAETRLRRPIWLSRGPLPAGCHRTDVAIDRHEVRRSAELHAYLVRAATAETPTAGYAWLAGARLADARTWDIRCEPRPVPPGRFLDVRYRSFREDEVLAPFHANVYHLELDDEQPVLWVNTDHGQLTPILSDKGSTGKRARLREVFYDLIAQGVWTQLFLRALDDLRSDGELTYDWEDTVLRELLPTMLPGHRSHAERLAALERAAERDGLPTLVGRLDAALQRRSEISRHMSRLVAETVEAPSR